jgi:hypothetical protein
MAAAMTLAAETHLVLIAFPSKVTAPHHLSYSVSPPARLGKRAWNSVLNQLKMPAK